MADFFYDLNTISNYYNDGAAAMSGFEIGAGMAASPRNNGVQLVGYTFPAYEDVQNRIPPEFSEPLPADGYIPAPPGACPAAAEPFSRFINASGDVVTPALFEALGLEVIPSGLINVSQGDPGSLFSIIQSLVPMNDQRLATAEGWRELLWYKLEDLQEPAESLMDYHLWTVQKDIIQQVTDSFYQSLVAQRVPQMVLDAFSESGNLNWFSSVDSHGEHALAQMDIKATLTGSVSGTVHEWRDFSIPGLGQTPVFGTQYGDGTVYFEHPETGRVECAVEIIFDQFDAQGRAINGQVTATSTEAEGYKIVFTYKPDGSKDGVIYDKDGNEIGQLTMTVDHEKFTNYIDVKEGTELKLPDDKPEFTHFQ
jgi:hypothetical protein